MALTQEIVAIVELCVYIPVALLAILVVLRHGFRKQLGWIYLVIFCLIRVAGAVFKILAEKNPDNKTDIEWSFILQSVGLSPLLMATMGLLKRITDQVSDRLPPDPESVGMTQYMSNFKVGNIITKRATAISRRSRTIQIAQLPTMIALILCIVGGTDVSSSDPATVAEGPRYTKIGVALFIVIYVLLFFLTVITVSDVRRAPNGEKRIYIAVVAALPLIAVRLLWSCLATYTTLSEFSIMNGNIVIQLCMATIEELVVVLMYIIAGLTSAK